MRRISPVIVPLLLAVSACSSASKQGEQAQDGQAHSGSPDQAAEQAQVQPEPKPAPAAEAPAGPRVEIGNRGEPCQRTLCIAGPGPLDQGANRDLRELCHQSPGVVRRCEGQGDEQVCFSLWSGQDWREGMDGLITSMDQDGDGKVGEGDPACSIYAVGWSTGATLAGDALPKALADDPRVGEGRGEIERMVLIAPYAPGQDTLEIPGSVRNAWIYRNTKSPEGDCSRAFEGGPWFSPKPVCGEGTQCWDYDYSYEPQLAFLSRQGARSGAVIGHCNMASVVAKIGLFNLIGGQEAWADQTPRFSDGTPSGAERRHPDEPPGLRLPPPNMD
ncbi:hypothetical protein G6O69_19565 [Pseudenhygromyxa sp. WMMC2535]|uniref:hypothetical protein n=1 Tax=Pseudenhygromyxa sp. WMMC2535 TaxID=2712867 RepID=UPI0015521455|nr:hypothetical protein [Pseudenhygromyxa sp. WMMC2535]NVB40053.1 hypothetical protein [Pseudenhygromyxa sp. WMMC2535]